MLGFVLYIISDTLRYARNLEMGSLHNKSLFSYFNILEVLDLYS